MTNDPAAAADNPDEFDADEWLAKVGSMPPVPLHDLERTLDETRDECVVIRLPVHPDDGHGNGTANLFRIPAKAGGEDQHGATWAVEVTFKDPKDTKFLATFATEAEARDWYKQRVDAAAGSPWSQ